MPGKNYQFLKNALGSNGESDECLLWPYNRVAEGYGQVWDGIKNRRVHVVAYAFTHGLDLPLPFIVRHTCDNPPCFNPKHLLSGTHSDNSQDAIKRLRRNPHVKCKLSKEQARVIRQRIQSGEKKADLAFEFNVSLSSVYRIGREEYYRHA